MTGPKESTVEMYLVDEATRYGAFCPKTVFLGRRGCPDREIAWPWGEADKVETKRPVGGRHEPGQLQIHREYARRMIPVYLLSTIEEVNRYTNARILRRHEPRLFSVPLPELTYKGIPINFSRHGEYIGYDTLNIPTPPGGIMRHVDCKEDHAKMAHKCVFCSTNGEFT